MAIITVRELKKTYTVRAKSGLFTREKRHVKALKGVSFDIGKGELVGYIGPNGAGKSTTVKILSGILVPDGGTCEVKGLCPWKQRVRHAANIGVVFGQRSQLWWDLPVSESFTLLRDIYRIGPADYKSSMNEIAGRLELDKLIDVPVRQLSLGQRMKCELAAALIHRPEVLFLDEPTIGLDATTKLAVRDFIKYINAERGVTAILTTHDMADIESLCSRVMLIGGGDLLMDGDLAMLRKGRDERVLTCRVALDAANARVSGAVNSIESTNDSITIHFNPAAVTAADLIGEINAKYQITDVTVENTPIERVVASVYSDLAKGAQI